MASGGKALFTIDTQINKTGILDAKRDIQSLIDDIRNKKIPIDFDTDKAIKELEKIQAAYNKSWNSKLNQLDLTAFRKNINDSFSGVDGLGNSMKQFGVVGQHAFGLVTRDVLTTNVQLKKSKTLLDSLAETMTNTVKWGITSSIFNTMTDSIQNAWNYAKALDSSLNDIRIVTGKSADEMASFAVQANKVAKSLGAATKDYTNASLIYYQQGLSEQDVQARAQTTLKAANVTGQTGQEVSEQLTAVWNGYKVSAEETELYVDKLAAVAAATAADLEELSTGMSKVASAANIMGVDIDQLNAQLATIVSVTRQAPESVGTALKTIYARMGDIQAGLDGEVTLDEYTSQMAEMGVNVLDTNGQLRDMGTVIEEIGSKWKTMSREQQISLSQVMAGTRQYNNLLSLFDSWDMYTNALNTSRDAAGTLQQQQEIYMESISAHLQQLSTEAERSYDIFFDEKKINVFIDGLTKALKIVNDIMGTMSSGNPLGALGTVGLAGANLFSGQIAQRVAKAKIEQDALAKNKSNQTLQSEINNWAREGISLSRGGAGLTAVGEAYNEIKDNLQNLSLEDQARYFNNLKNLAILKEQESVYKNIRNEVAEVKDLEKWENQFQKVKDKKSNIDTEITNKQKELDKLKKYTDEESANIKRLKEEQKEADKILKQAISNKKNKYDDAEAGQKRSLTNAVNKAQKDVDTKNRAIENAQREAEENLQTRRNNLQEEISSLEKRRDLMSDFIDKRESKNEKVKRAKKAQAELDRTDTQGLENQLSQTTEELKGLTEQADLSNTIENNIQGFTALGQAITGVVGILRTLSDETISTEDKINQITSTLLYTLPMVIMNWQEMGVALQKSWGWITTTFSNPMSVLTSPVFMITLAVIGLIAEIKILTDEYNKLSNAAENASNNARDAINNYEQVAAKASELKSSIDSFEESEEYLQNLTGSTEELKQALEDTNNKAKELIETYGLYGQYTMQGGVIKFNEGVLENLEKESSLRERRAESLKLNAQMLASRRELESDTLDLQRAVGIGPDKMSDSAMKKVINNLTSLEDLDFSKVTRSDEAFSKWIDSISEGDFSINRLSEQIVDNRTEFINLAKQTKEVVEAQKYYQAQLNANAIEELYGDRLTKISSNLKTGELDSARYSQILDIINNTKVQEEIQNQALANKNKYQNMDVNLSGDKITDQEAWSNEFDQAAGAVIIRGFDAALSNIPIANYFAKFIDEDNLQGNLNEKVTDDLKALGVTVDELNDIIGTSNIDSNKKLAEAYAKISGVNIEGATWEDDKFIDAQGNTLLDASSANKRGNYRASIFNAVRELVESEQAQKEGETETTNAIDIIEDATEQAYLSGQKYGVDFSSGMLDAFSSGNFNMESLYARLDPNEVAELESKTDDEIMQMMGITAEQLNTVAGMTAEEFGKSFRAGLEKYEWNVNEAISAAMTAKGEEFELLGLSKGKLEQYQEEVEVYAKSLMVAAEDSEMLADSLELDADAATEVAFAVIKMNKAIDTLADNFKDWKKILQSSTKESQEFAEASHGIREALADIYNTQSNWISNDFIKEHLEEIGKIAEGDEKAIESLRKELTQDILVSILIHNEASDSEIATLKSQLEALQNQVPDILVGTHLDIAEIEGDEAKFIESMNALIEAANLTAEQANAIFSTMGFEATYATEPVPMDQEVPEYVTETVDEGTHTKTFDDGTKQTFTKTRTRTYQDGVYKAEGKMMAVGMTVNEEGKAVKTAPKITGITKTGSGSMNNYSSSNKGGGSPGKSGGSSKKADKKDPIENKKDVYHDIDIILKQISTDLERLESQEKKLVGQDLIDNLNEQWDRLQDTIGATNEKIKIARGEMSRLQGELGAKGVTFNPDGTIANYAAAYDQQLAAVNAVINHYNSLSAEGQEAYKDTVEQAEKNWEEFLDNISEYDELVSETIPELEDDIQAAIDEQIEIQIEKFNMEIELRLDMAEAERDWNEFKKRIIDDIEDDDILGNASAKLLDYNSYYKEDGTGVIQKNTQHVNEIIEQLKSIEATGTSSIYGDNEAQALEDLKTYYEQLMSDLTDVHDLIDEIRESYLDMMDEAQDKFDEQVETYEYIRDLLTHDMDLITMVYGDEAYDKLVDFYEKQEDNYNKQLDFQRQQKDFWKAQMDSLEEGSDEWQKAKENWMSAVEEWNSLVEEAIENLQDKYLNAINNIFANLNDKVTGGLGLDYVEQEWDLINKNADQYLDTINAVFETQQLENKYLDAIDDTDNISAQRKLNDLMKEEIAALEQKDKLTQYDIDRANLKYEIALKQIALEEAQQTKSSMRLRRDSQGNYRYEFVADNDAIAEAEDELSVLQNQLYNMDVEQYRSNLDQLYEIYVEWQEALAEAAQINDPEARAERELMINEQYGELINGIVAENEVIKTNLRESAFDELVNLHQMELEEVEALSQAEKDIMLEDMIPQWTSGVQTMADAFAGEGGFIPTCKDALNELDNATQDYEDSLVELQYQGGFTFNDIVAGENEAIYTAQGLLQVNNALISSYQAEFDALNAVLGQLDGLIEKYGSAQNAANAAAEAAYRYADALLAQFAAAQGSYTGEGRFYGSSGSSSGGNLGNFTSISNSSGSGNSGSSSKTFSENSNSSSNGSTKKIYTNLYDWQILDSNGNIIQTGSDAPSISQSNILAYNDNLLNNKTVDSVDIRKKLLGYSTGGYTGEWNSDGRLALLHQKELVLNQRDTENILGAVEIMRQVTNSIDNSIFSRVADFTSGIGVAAPELSSEALEQNVHIEANFPNVQSSREIEEAINNLTNIASQRANKSTRY